MGWNAFKRRRPKGKKPAPAASDAVLQLCNNTAKGIGRGYDDSIVPVEPHTRRDLATNRTTTTTTTTSTTAIITKAAPHEPRFVMAPAAFLTPILEEGLHRRPPLAVKVQVSIADRSAYSRIYTSSQNLSPTDRLCQGLIRRVEHCSKEFITRRDSEALLHRRFGQAPSPLRYEISYTILRFGVVWAEESFKSYQRLTVTDELANEILVSTHHIVGLFLRQHDKDFIWTQEPASDRLCKRLSASSSLSPYDALTLGCVPQSRFIESTQSFEFIPGYCIELSFRSFNQHRRAQRDWTRSIQLKSTQDSPLNLAQSERLLWDSFDAVNTAISVKKRSFEIEHASCDWLEGPVDCHHFEENALAVELRISNNLGPVYEHLHRGIRSKLSIFRHPDGEDCHAFLQDLQTELLRLRDVADEHVSHTNDFELRILELTGAQGWNVLRPTMVTLDHAKSHSQRTVEAILDRVHTGVTDVLRDAAASVHIAAYKRGHLILDREIGALNRTDKRPVSALSGPVSIEAEKDRLVLALESRIRQDLDTLLKDTCILEELPEHDERILTPTTLASLQKINETAQLDHTYNSAATQDPVRRFPLARSPEESPAVMPQQESPRPLRRKKTFIMPASGDSPAYRVFPLVPTRFVESRSRQNSHSTLSSQISEPSTAVLKKVNVQPVHVIDPELFREHALSISDGSASEFAGTVPDILSESDPSECGGTELSVAEDHIFTQASSLMSDAQDSVAGDIVELDCLSASQASVTQVGSQPTGQWDGRASGDEAISADVEAADEAYKRGSMARDVDSIPSTPGLSHGEGPSPRESFMMTPTYSSDTIPVTDPTIPVSYDPGQTGDGLHLAYPPSESEDEEKTPTGTTPQMPLAQQIAPALTSEAPEPDTIVLAKIDSSIVQSKEASFALDQDQALTDYHPSASGTPTQSVAELVAASFVAVPVPDVEPPQTAGTIVAPAPAAESADDNVFDAAFAEKQVAQHPTAPTNSRPPTSLGESLPELQLARSRRTIERPAPILITRNSVSSWEDYISMSQRDSVDTIKTEVDESELVTEDQPPARRKSIPTAGYLGLHEAENRRAGPFGALKSAFSGGQHWLDSDRFRGSGSSSRPQTAPGLAAQKLFLDGASTPPPPESPVTSTTKSPRRPYIRKRTKSVATASIGRVTPKRPLKPHRGRAKSAAFAELDRGREQKECKGVDGRDGNGEKPMLPRFMMLFAGMAVASSMLNKH